MIRYGSEGEEERCNIVTGMADKGKFGEKNISHICYIC
jgi:hypothetical protein